MFPIHPTGTFNLQLLPQIHLQIPCLISINQHPTRYLTHQIPLHPTQPLPFQSPSPHTPIVSIYHYSTHSHIPSSMATYLILQTYQWHLHHQLPTPVLLFKPTYPTNHHHCGVHWTYIHRLLHQPDRTLRVRAEPVLVSLISHEVGGFFFLIAVY